MAELKGAMFSILLVMVFIVPGLFNIALGGIQNYAFLKTTQDVADVVKEEGGITDEVETIIDRLSDNGYTIEYHILKEDGTVEYGKDVAFGDRVVLDYTYEYVNWSKTETGELGGGETMVTQNSALISRR